MNYQEIFTFKTRRKYILLFSLLMLSYASDTFEASVQICPDNCECYVDLEYEYNLHTASCGNLVWNKSYFPKIIQLKLKPVSPANECRIFNFTSRMFPNLQRLDMSNCSLTGIPSPEANDLKNLDSIDLSNNVIRDIHSKALLPYNQLRHLTLTNNPLNPGSLSALESTSLYELVLDSCGIQNMDAKMFAGVPNLKFLSLSNNSVATLSEKSMPTGLRTIDLSKNKLVNVNTDELSQLPNLAEVNLASNPINCTCNLIAFQEWLSGKGVIFVDGITCALPRKFAGRNLNRVPASWCDKEWLATDASSSNERCSPNQICNNGVVIDDGYLNDQDKDENKNALVRDEVMPVGEKEALIVEDIHQAEQLDGSGDGDGTEMPLEAKKSVKTTSTTVDAAPMSTEHLSHPPTESAPNSLDGIVRVEHELGAVSETTDKGLSTPEITTQNSNYSVEGSAETSAENVTSSSERNENNVGRTTQTVPEHETMATENNGTNAQLQEHLRHDSGRREMFGYVIPGVAVLLVGCVCLAVYCSQCASKMDSYKPTEANAEGAELQEVSLLPDNHHPTIVKHSNKYPGEKENGQTEKLMNDHERTNGGSNFTTELNGNASQHSDETIDCCKLANGQSTTNQNAQGNVECTVVKVTTLPDSVPKTAVIRDL